MTTPGAVLSALLLFGVSLAVPGCGSSGGAADSSVTDSGVKDTGGDGSGGAEVGISPEFHWKKNGVVESANYADALHVTSPTSDSVYIRSNDPLLSISVTTAMGALNGTHTCETDGGSAVAFTYGSLDIAIVESCSVKIALVTGSDGREHVTGTFEATLSSGDAGITTLSEGVFDIADLRPPGG